jgi:hypothetical protein
MLFFALDLPVTLAIETWKVAPKTAVDTYSLLREVCEIEMVNMPKLGGPGKVVEVDETFVSRSKNNRGRRSMWQPGKDVEKEPGTWVVGAIERESRRVMVSAVKSRDRETLFPLLDHFVKDGIQCTIVIW